MGSWRYEISPLLVFKNVKLKYFSTLEEKFRISVRACNILFTLLYAWLSLTYGWAVWIKECCKDCQVITLASCHCSVRLTEHTSTATGIPNRRLF